MGMLLFAQADIAPLMASLIGVPFPLNSVVRSTNVFHITKICLQRGIGDESCGMRRERL